MRKVLLGIFLVGIINPIDIHAGIGDQYESGQDKCQRTYTIDKPSAPHQVCVTGNGNVMYLGITKIGEKGRNFFYYGQIWNFVESIGARTLTLYRCYTRGAGQCSSSIEKYVYVLK